MPTELPGPHYLRQFLKFYVMCLFLCYSCIITNLKARITDAFVTVTEDMLGNTWRETDYRIDVLRATKGTHVEVYWCVVKKTCWVTFRKKKCLCYTYSSFLVINVCNLEKTLWSPCIWPLMNFLLFAIVALHVATDCLCAIKATRTETKWNVRRCTGILRTWHNPATILRGSDVNPYRTNVENRVSS